MTHPSAHAADPACRLAWKRMPLQPKPPPRWRAKIAFMDSRAEALATAADLDFSPRHGYFHDHVAAAAHARALVKDIPLPTHHPGVACIDWQAQGPMSDGDMRALLQFRATCDWLRERIANGPSEATDHVLATLATWPTHRGGATGEALRNVAIRAHEGDLTPAEQFVALHCRARPR